jgi:hypothetical protein
MGTISTAIQAQASFKAFIAGLAHTSPIRSWFQELYSAKQTVYSDRVRTDVVPAAMTQVLADTAAINNPTIIQKTILKQMTLVPGSNGMAFAVYNTIGDTASGLDGDWISPFDRDDTRGFYPRFYRDAAGTSEIMTSDGITGWFFYPEGIFVHAGDTVADNFAADGITTVYVTFYKYIGQFLDDKLTEIIANNFDPDSIVTSTRQVVIKNRNGTISTKTEACCVVDEWGYIVTATPLAAVVDANGNKIRGRDGHYLTNRPHGIKPRVKI